MASRRRCERKPAEITVKGKLKRVAGRSRVLFGAAAGDAQRRDQDAQGSPPGDRVPGQIVPNRQVAGSPGHQWRGPAHGVGSALGSSPTRSSNGSCWPGLANVTRVFLNVGAGPLTQPLSKFFVRRALRMADYASFRDEESRALVRQIGFGGRSQVVRDSVYSLESPVLEGSRGCRGRDRRLVGLAPMPYCDPRVFPEKDQAVYDEFIGKLGLFGVMARQPRVTR